MPAEIEIKLEASPKKARALAGRPWLKKLATAPAKRQRLVSVYYDTDGMALQDKGVSLRVRRVDGKLVQTVKQGGAGPFGRQEWEWRIDRPKPDLGKAHESALGGFKRKKLKGKLRPLFETDVTRATIPVRYQGSDIEIALDHGEVKSGRKRQPISEIELELRGGRPGGMVRLAERIAREAGAHYGVLPKAARGYALRDDALQEPVCASPVVLEDGMTAADCFQAVALNCLHHFAANEKAVLAGEPEGVHQMRVGLRRLRSAISFFKTLLRGSETEKIKHELKWLTEQLAPARDMDVLAKDSIRKLEKSHPDQTALPVLEKDVRARRAHGFVQAGHAVQSAHYHRLVLATALWIAGGAWVRDQDGLAMARRRRDGKAFAGDEMSRRLDKVHKGLGKLDKLSPLKRHKLRIKVKKLRYAMAFFESLFGHARSRKKFQKAMKSLQSALGKLNDIRVHGDLAKDYVRPPRGRLKTSFAMGLLTGHEDAAEKKLLARADKAGKKLSGLSPFWQ